MSNGWDSVQRKYRGTKPAPPQDDTKTRIAELRAVPSRNKQVVIGLSALIVCVAALVTALKKTKEKGAPLSSILGDTSSTSIVKSLLPGLSFVIFYYGLRANIIAKMRRLDGHVPESTMPLVVSAFASSCFMQLLYTMTPLEPVANPFAFGNALGVIVGSLIAERVF